MSDELAIPELESSDASVSNPRETERTMLDRLNARYAKYDAAGIRFTRAEHVKLTTGFDTRRICDYMAMSISSSYGADGGPRLHGHEVKVSRADWLTELRDPTKAEAFARYCDHWWLVVSDKTIVKPGELPEGWGLLVASGGGLRASVPAPKREAEPMPRSLQATLTRSVTKTTIRLARTDRAMAFLASKLGVVT